MEILKPYRDRIDALDDHILRLLAERTQIVREVGQIKARDGIALVQGARVDEVIGRCAAIAEQSNINPDLVRLLYQAIIDEAHRIEGEIIERK